jgi:DNA-binding CsgD family transcriptional regulator
VITMPADNCAHRETRGGGRVGPPWYWCPVAYGGKQVTPAIHCGPEKCEHYRDPETTEATDMAAGMMGKGIPWDELAMDVPVNWTGETEPDDDLTLREHCLALKQQGLSWQKIGDLLGITGNSVQAAVDSGERGSQRNKGLQWDGPANLTADNYPAGVTLREHCRDLLSRGVKQAELARALGIAPAGVQQAVARLDKPTRRCAKATTKPASPPAATEPQENPSAGPEPLAPVEDIPGSAPEIVHPSAQTFGPPLAPVEDTTAREPIAVQEQETGSAEVEPMAATVPFPPKGSIEVTPTTASLRAFVESMGLLKDAAVFCAGYNAALAATTTERS